MLLALCKKLYLNSLVNNYDNERYELCTNENLGDSSDFNLWKNGENYAVYDIENGKYKNGIASGETITSYIQFKINKEHLRNMLERTSEATEHLENAPESDAPAWQVPAIIGRNAAIFLFMPVINRPDESTKSYSTRLT